MEKVSAQTADSAERAHAWQLARETAIVIGTSIFIALCARVTIPLPFTPVPLTVQNFGVLLAGLLLGSRRGFAAMVLYLAEGAAGMPVFSPTGAGGIAQLFGVTGGFLLAYPVVAWLAGYVTEQGRKNFLRAASGALLGETFLFASGLTWLAIVTHSFTQAFRWGFYWFVFAEIIKVLMAAGIASRWEHYRKA